MSKKLGKLVLSKETLRNITTEEGSRIRGGYNLLSIAWCQTRKGCPGTAYSRCPFRCDNGTEDGLR